MGGVGVCGGVWTLEGELRDAIKGNVKYICFVF